MRILFCLVFAFTFYGCAKKRDCGCVMPYQVYYLKAKVVQTSDFCCYKPNLDFSEDSLRIHTLTNLNNLVFTVAGLPDGYRVQDKKLYVLVTALKPEDAFICNTMGLPLPALKVTDAKERD